MGWGKEMRELCNPIGIINTLEGSKHSKELCYVVILQASQLQLTALVLPVYTELASGRMCSHREGSDFKIT